MEKKNLHAFCLTLPRATHDFKGEWQADRYQVAGKMFAMICEDSQGKALISLKCDQIVLKN